MHPSQLTPLEVPPGFEYTIFRHESTVGIERNFGIEVKAAGHDLVAMHDQYAEEYAEHIARSRTSIMRAVFHAPEAKKGGEKTAIILGGSPYRDIPLERILSEGNVDRVDLLDLDEHGVRAAVEKLSPHLQRRCRIIIADITGGIARDLGNAIQDVGQHSQNFIAFTSELNALIGNIHPTLPNFGESVGNYSLVISQLVLSQLPAYPRDYLDRIAKERFGISNISDRMSELFSAIGVIGARMQQEHVRFLAHAARPGGIVFFADTFMHYINIRNLHTNKLELYENANDNDNGLIIEWHDLEEIFRVLFDLDQDPLDQIGEDRCWHYHNIPSSGPHNRGDSFTVVALELKKPNESMQQ